MLLSSSVPKILLSYLTKKLSAKMTSTGRQGIVLTALPMTDLCPQKHKIVDLSRENDITHLSQSIVTLQLLLLLGQERGQAFVENGCFFSHSFS